MSDYAPRKGMTDADIAAVVEAILADATLEEKVAMMSGRGFFQQIQESGGRWGGHPYRAGGGCERLGVPAFHFTDGPRGVARGNSTCFPCSMARGASFDTDLERRIGQVMGIEARAQGCTLSGAVCINLLRHPAWGRAQETYGEDPHHVGEMGAALAEGIQAHNVAASAKHFAVNSIENARFKVDVAVDQRTLREVYLPHFKRVLDAGCASVMSAYNKLNGEFCGQHRELLTDILRHEWGFDGFVHSDWVLGVHKPYGASAGLDVENPEPLVFGSHLVDAVEQGAIEPAVVDTACRRILTTLYRFASAQDPLDDYAETLIACDAHRALAREAAEKSAVLLKNDTMLPLARTELKTVAVLGRLADLENIGDMGSSRVEPPYVITPLAGLAEALGDGVEILRGDETDLDAARKAAARADAVIVVAGYTADDEGEFIPGDIALGMTGNAASGDLKEMVDNAPAWPSGGDRDRLTLSADQEALILAAAEANPSTAVVVVAGSAVIMEAWRHKAAAIVQSFYAGMEGGRALADLLLGDVCPSGKLPFTVPVDAADLPFFDKDADAIDYGPLHGYTLFDADGKTPAYPFGFGLSYTTFAYRALTATRRGDHIDVSVAVTNTGTVAGEEIVQLYAGFPGTAAPRPAKLLRGFTRVSLAPGQTRMVHMAVPVDQLRWWDPDTRQWKLESGDHRILVGGSSRDDDLLGVRVGL